MASQGEAVATGSACGSVMGGQGGAEARAAARAARKAAFKKLTAPERREVYAGNNAVAQFLLDNNAEVRRRQEEDPYSTFRPEETLEWRAELARILDAYSLPDSMLKAGVEDYMRKYTLPPPLV